MTEISTDKLVPVSTDMYVGMLGNTDKLLSSDKRWNYADHRGECDEELDVDVDGFMNKSKKDLHSRHGSLFTKPDNKDRNSDNRHNSHRDSKHESKHEDKNNDNEDDVKYSHHHDYNTSPVSDNAKYEGDTTHMSKKELMLEKLAMLRKLGELKQCGVHLSQNYSLDSDLDTMKYEYTLHHDIRSKQGSVQWMSHMMIGIVKGMEMLNDNYNPFDIKMEGLSNKIGSDMTSYYTVLGDIYEKYNQPGKQMAPEMRLLLMISGAAIGMQVNKVIPGIGGMSNAVRSEENVEILRQKAEEDSNKRNEYFTKQHDEAAQKAADIKMIQEKELEMKRMSKLSNMKKFKDNLILSSEAPSRDYVSKSRDDMSKPSRTVKNNNKYNKSDYEENKENEEEDDDDETQPLTQNEIDNIRKMRYIEEQKQLEMLRRTAHAKSEMFRNDRLRNDTDDKRRRDLERQNQQLDEIIGTLDSREINTIDRNDRNNIRSTKNKPITSPSPKISNMSGKSTITSKPTFSQKSTNSPKPTYVSSNKRSDNKSDNRSTSSSASSISINPNVGTIMKKTADKARKEGQIKYSNFSDSDVDEKKEKIIPIIRPKPLPSSNINNINNTSNKNNTINTINTKPVSKPIPKLVNNNMNINTNTPSSTPKSIKSKSSLSDSKYDIKFDEKIEMLLENNSSDFDDMSREEISIGSRGKDKKQKFNINASASARSESSSLTNNKTKSPELFDFGAISIGSKNKGAKMTIATGKK